MHRSPIVRTLIAVGLTAAIAACGGREGPITLVTGAPPGDSTAPPTTVGPVFTTILPSPATTVTTSTTSATSATTDAAPSTTTVDPAPDDRAITALAALTVDEEQPLGYDRSLFRHWIDSDGDGCDTRAEVLLAESVGAVRSDGGCHIAAGVWYSTYDGMEWTAAAELDIDHVVALAEAWRSGAWQWSAAARQSFANDLTDERTLIAVTGSTNRSKGDDDPADWLPPRSADTCRYIGDWLSIKLRWGLTVDATEHDALAALLHSRCAGLVLAAVAPPPVSTAAVVFEIPVATWVPTGGSGGDVYYANCDAVQAAGMDPLHLGDPGYRSGLDRDGDGVACE